MNELRIKSKAPGSLKPLIEVVLEASIRTIKDGIQEAEKGLKEFEEKYQLSTDEFLRKYRKRELGNNLEFCEWMGIFGKFKKLVDEAEGFKGLAIAESHPDEIKISSQRPKLLKKLVKAAVENELLMLSNSIRRTEKCLREFETKYQRSTKEFLCRYQNDEFEETLELDEWIGQSLMLASLQEDAEKLRGIEFVS